MASSLRPRLVPELAVSDLAASLRFWVDVAGFEIAYDRPEEGFACLDRPGARLMLEERGLARRRFEAAPPEQPFGRGVNLEIGVDDLDAILARAANAGLPFFLPLEEKRYRRGTGWVDVRQAILQDPDGYLARFSQTLDER